MYLVIALHDTGHGQVESPVLATESVSRALEAARMVEELGYEFHGSDSYVALYMLESEHTYSKMEFNLSERTSASLKTYPILLTRTKANGEWKEDWSYDMAKSE